MIHPNGYNDVWQLDYNNTALVNAMNDCLKFWIDQADVDGYRCDYISSSRIPTSYWQTAIPLIKNYKSGKTITFLGEGDIAQDVTRLKTAGFDYDYAWAYQSSLANYGSNGVYSSTLKANANTMLNASANVSRRNMVSTAIPSPCSPIRSMVCPSSITDRRWAAIRPSTISTTPKSIGRPLILRCSTPSARSQR